MSVKKKIITLINILIGIIDYNKTIKYFITGVLKQRSVSNFFLDNQYNKI